MAVSQRRFGVELEHGNRQYNYANVLRKLGEKGFKTSGDYPNYPNCYTACWDGSGVEIRTPALAGVKGLEELKEVIKYLVSIGGYVGRPDGMHVHHEAEEFVGNWEAIAALANTWINNRGHIRRMVAAHRWGPRSYNGELRKKVVEDACKAKAARFSRQDLNLASLWRHGTVEIRLHEGCLDPKQAIAWVVFGQALIDTVAKKGEFGSRRTPRGLLEYIGVADKYAETLIQRTKEQRIRKVLA